MARLTGIIGKSIVGAALALGMATPALADQGPITAYFPGNGAPTPAQAVFYVPVKASIGGSCKFATGGAPNQDYTIPNPIDTTLWTRDVQMTVECTGPSRLAIVSANGGLLSAASTATGYTNLAPYTVDVNIAQAGPAVMGGCPAASLKASSAATCTLRGTAAPTVGLPFGTSVNLSGSYVRVSAPAYNTAYPGAAILVAGTYQDTLIVTVSPAS